MQYLPHLRRPGESQRFLRKKIRGRSVLQGGDVKKRADEC
jgi:hypothetical protein